MTHSSLLTPNHLPAPTEWLHALCCCSLLLWLAPMNHLSAAAASPLPSQETPKPDATRYIYCDCCKDATPAWKLCWGLVPPFFFLSYKYYPVSTVVDFNRGEGIKKNKLHSDTVTRAALVCGEQLVHPLCFLVPLQHLPHSVEPEQLLFMFHANVLWLHSIQQQAKWPQRQLTEVWF